MKNNPNKSKKSKKENTPNNKINKDNKLIDPKIHRKGKRLTLKQKIKKVGDKFNERNHIKLNKT